MERPGRTVTSLIDATSGGKISYSNSVICWPLEQRIDLDMVRDDAEINKAEMVLDICQPTRSSIRERRRPVGKARWSFEGRLLTANGQCIMVRPGRSHLVMLEWPSIYPYVHKAGKLKCVIGIF